MNDRRLVERHVEHVMGTAFSFAVLPGGRNRLDVRYAIGSACRWLHHVDEVFSTWKPGSTMSRLRRGEMLLDDAGDDVHVVVELCHRARTDSQGWFDPWALPGGFDPTGLVKGWAAQEALSILTSAGVGAAMINGGGDVATFGHPFPERPWVIGIQDPNDRRRCISAVMSPGAVATSGIYERGAHVLDPHTGQPVCSVLSATVVGPDLAMADALATAVLAAGERGLDFVQELRGYSALIIDRAGRLSHTSGLPSAMADTA